MSFDARFEDDIERLYDNWFIETCEEWVVPYIADLLAVRGLLPSTGAQSTERGVVANTIVSTATCVLTPIACRQLGVPRKR